MDIPQGSFERSGWTFTLTDIIRRESANAETRDHAETVTLDSQTNELAQILALLGNTMEYRAEDGFVGMLSLDVSSINVETAGTRTTSHTMTVTREYPNLSTRDTSLVPKTIVDRGTTYTLAGVDWRVGNYTTVDYERIPDYYNAVATYTATGSRTTVTGYTVTAEYSGSLARLSQGRTTYIAYFIGEEIRTPLEMVTPSPTPDPIETSDVESNSEPCDESADKNGKDTIDENSDETSADPIDESDAEPDDETALEDSEEKRNGALLTVIAVAAAAAGGAYYYFKKRKGKPYNEKTDNTAADPDDDSGDDDTGTGG
jgi:hypothetical protein